MKTNVGSYDAGLRFLLGCGILAIRSERFGWWCLLGLIPILTTAFSFCPLYRLLHIDTAAWERDYENRHERSTCEGKLDTAKNWSKGEGLERPRLSATATTAKP